MPELPAISLPSSPSRGIPPPIPGGIPTLPIPPNIKLPPGVPFPPLPPPIPTSDQKGLDIRTIVSSSGWDERNQPAGRENFIDRSNDSRREESSARIADPPIMDFGNAAPRNVDPRNVDPRNDDPRNLDPRPRDHHAEFQGGAQQIPHYSNTRGVQSPGHSRDFDPRSPNMDRRVPLQDHPRVNKDDQPILSWREYERRRKRNMEDDERFRNQPIDRPRSGRLDSYNEGPFPTGRQDRGEVPGGFNEDFRHPGHADRRDGGDHRNMNNEPPFSRFPNQSFDDRSHPQDNFNRNEPPRENRPTFPPPSSGEPFFNPRDGGSPQPRPFLGPNEPPRHQGPPQFQPQFGANPRQPVMHGQNHNQSFVNTHGPGPPRPPFQQDFNVDTRPNFTPGQMGENMGPNFQPEFQRGPFPPRFQNKYQRQS